VETNGEICVGQLWALSLCLSTVTLAIIIDRANGPEPPLGHPLDNPPSQHHSAISLRPLRSLDMSLCNHWNQLLPSTRYTLLTLFSQNCSLGLLHWKHIWLMCTERSAI